MVLDRVEMEDTELEEGEATYYEDDANIDPDIALSYIDEKIHSVLGHFQKDFEGGVSAENLGAKFGGYGSFLPTYQRSPSVWSQPKTPQRIQNSNSPISPKVLPTEGASENSAAPSAVRSLRLGTASLSLQSLHTAKAPSGDVLAKPNSCLSSAQVIEKSLLRHEPVLNKPLNPTDQRTLKVRIKVGSDNATKKNVAIYSGLGLASPSSSMEDSPDESGGSPSDCQNSLDKSPKGILEVMTSFLDPGGLMLSPLDESLLCLPRKDKISPNNKPVPVMKSGQEYSACLAVDLASSMRIKKLPKEKKTKMMENSDNLVALKQESGMDSANNTATLVKPEIGMDSAENKTTLVKQEVNLKVRNLVNEIQSRKECVSNNTKLKTTDSVSNVADTVKGAVLGSVVPSGADRNILVKKTDVVKKSMRVKLSTGLVKKESLKSSSDHDGNKYEKLGARSSSAEKIRESKLKNSHQNASIGVREGGQSNSNKVSVPFKADTNVSKCKSDLYSRESDHSRQKSGWIATYEEQDEIKMPHAEGRFSFEGKKKSKGRHSSGKLVVSEAEESMMGDACEVSKDKKAGKMKNIKMHKVRHDYKDMLPKTGAERINIQMNSLDRPISDRAWNSNLESFEEDQRAFLDKSKEKEISTRKKIDTQLKSEPFSKEAANDGCPFEGVSSKLELPAVAPVVIEEDWVCCDQCQKWRLLPYGTKPEQLPEKWLCSMLNWLPGMNRCDISEDETTKALHAVYQLPLPESQNNHQKFVNKTAAGASSADALHFGQNNLNFNLHGMPNPRKKKRGSKVAPYATGSGGPIQMPGSTKNSRQEVVKSRSLNDMNQPIPEANLTSNSVQNLSNSCNFPVGDMKPKKLQSKREADQRDNRTAKKIKADIAFEADKYCNTEHSGRIDKIGFGSGSSLPSKVAVKSMGKHDQPYCSKDAKPDRVAKVQSFGTELIRRASLPLQTVFLGMETVDERELSLKKRKLKDWQESKNCAETPLNNVNNLPDSKGFLKEESSESEFRKAKKSRVSKGDGKEPSTSKDDDTLNRKGKVTKILLSGSREKAVHVKEESRIIQKHKQLRKHKTVVASKPASDDMDSLKRDLGAELFSRAAASSSSKVSDSRKSRTNCLEVKGSPVESVSSSPMRTSNYDKLSPAIVGISGKDVSRNSDFPGMDNLGRSLDREGNAESNRFGTRSGKKVSNAPHLESLGLPEADFWHKSARQKFGGKSKPSVMIPSVFQNSHVINSDANNLESPCPGDVHASGQRNNEDKMHIIPYHDNTLFQCGKGPYLLSKDKDRSSANKLKVSTEMEIDPKQGPRDEVQTDLCHVALVNEESGDFKCQITPINDDESVGGRSYRKWQSDRKKENQYGYVEHDVSDAKLGGVLGRKDSRGTRVAPQQNGVQDFGSEVAKRSDPIQVEPRDRSSQLSQQIAGEEDLSAHVSHSVPDLLRGSACDITDSSGNGDISKVSKQPTIAVHDPGYPVPNAHVFKDIRSPVGRDVSMNIASIALKEAEEFRDYADHLKETGFGFECNEVYFQAALKFLHSAWLLETSNSDSNKHGEMSQMQNYNTTAKLCENCAHEYEKREEMAAAALAYKCMEVAYMRVVYCKNSSTNRDRHDLQASLQMAPQGESPSSSASDLDNLNNQAMVEKAAPSKGISSHGGNHAIVAKSRSNFVRLLEFTKNVSSAMEASRKSQNAFAAANIILKEAQNKEDINTIRRAIDFSFQDVEEFVRLVRLAIEAISRRGFCGSKD